METDILIEKKDKIDIACERYKMLRKSKNLKFNQLDNWLDKESELFIEEITHTKQNYKKYARGQIVKVNFGINVGTELCYTHFAIVITKIDTIKSDCVMVIPITSKKGNCRISLGHILHESHPNSTKYNLECFANVSQMTAISKKRILQEKKEYICGNDILDKIDDGIIKFYTKDRKTEKKNEQPDQQTEQTEQTEQKNE